MLEPGDRVRDIVIQRTIATTAMSTVYHAVDEALGREVALKEFNTSRLDDSNSVERFLREGKIAASLPRHPNLVTIYAAFEDAGVPYISMEYYPLGDLSALRGPLTTPQVMTALADGLAALTVAEAHQVVHRDLKLENVLRSHQGSLRVTDFGIAKSYHPTAPSGLTGEGEFHGTPLYVAPEVASGADAGPRSDLYSLGVIAYRLLAGRFPFEGDPYPVVVAKTTRDPESLARVCPGLHIAIAKWVDRLLDRQPERRFGTAVEASEALEAARAAANLIREPLPTTPPIDPTTSPPPVEPEDGPPHETEPTPERGGWATIAELEAIEQLGTLTLHAVTLWLNVAVALGLVVAGAILDEPWLFGVALAAWAILSLLTFFDRNEAVKVREAGHWWAGPGNPRARGSHERMRKR